MKGHCQQNCVVISVYATTLVLMFMKYCTFIKNWQTNTAAFSSASMLKNRSKENGSLKSRKVIEHGLSLEPTLSGRPL